MSASIKSNTFVSEMLKSDTTIKTHDAIVHEIKRFKQPAHSLDSNKFTFIGDYNRFTDLSQWGIVIDPTITADIALAAGASADVSGVGKIWLRNEFLASMIVSSKVAFNNNQVRTFSGQKYEAEFQQRLATYFHASKKDVERGRIGVTPRLRNTNVAIATAVGGVRYTPALATLHAVYDPEYKMEKINGATGAITACSQRDEDSSEWFIPLSVFLPMFTEIHFVKSRIIIEIEFATPVNMTNTLQPEYRFSASSGSSLPLFPALTLANTFMATNELKLSSAGHKQIRKDTAKKVVKYPVYEIQPFTLAKDTTSFEKYLDKKYSNIHSIHIFSTGRTVVTDKAQGDVLTDAKTTATILPFKFGIGQDMIDITDYRIDIGDLQLTNDKKLKYESGESCSDEAYQNYLDCTDSLISDKYFTKEEFSEYPILSIPVARFLYDEDRDERINDAVGVNIQFDCTALSEERKIYVAIERLEIAVFECDTDHIKTRTI